MAACAALQLSSANQQQLTIPLMTAFVQKTITDTNEELEFKRGVVTDNCWAVGFLDRMRAKRLLDAGLPTEDTW